jgi:hypothetical protein
MTFCCQRESLEYGAWPMFVPKWDWARLARCRPAEDQIFKERVPRIGEVCYTSKYTTQY